MRHRTVAVYLPVEISVDFLGGKSRLHHADMAGEILRLHMEAGRHRNAVLFAYRDSLPGQRKRHQKMNNISTFDSILKYLGICLSRNDLIPCERGINDRPQIKRRHDAETTLALFVSIAANDSDIMSLRLQMIDQIVSCDARAVVRLAEHIAYDRDIHTTSHPYIDTLLFASLAYIIQQDLKIKGMRGFSGRLYGEVLRSDTFRPQKRVTF